MHCLLVPTYILHTVSTKEIFRGNCYWESYSSVTMEGIMKFLCLAPKLHLHITHSDKTERKSFLLYIYLKGFTFTFPFSYISFGCVSVSVWGKTLFIWTWLHNLSKFYWKCFCLNKCKCATSCIGFLENDRSSSSFGSTKFANVQYIFICRRNHIWRLHGVSVNHEQGDNQGEDPLELRLPRHWQKWSHWETRVDKGDTSILQ